MDSYWLRECIHRLPGRVIHAFPLPKPEVIAGEGVRRQIGEICCKEGYERVLVVTDQTLHQLGYDSAILESLKASGVHASLFYDIHSEPNTAIIEAGRKQALEIKAKAIIALGGGSVMDSCKMIAASCKMPRWSVRRLLLKILPVPGCTMPLIMVPSTAGTGAEITIAAVVTNSRGTKGSTVLIGMNVTHVVHDSELTKNAPKHVTAACGIDALSHCIEGVVSHTKVSEEDMHKSMEGVKLILENLPLLCGSQEVLTSTPLNVKSQEDLETARLNMAKAAMYGGNAINTQLAGYVHAFAHSIGAKYHLSHGQAISLMLMPVLEFQQEACRAHYDELAKYCGVPDFLQAVRNLLNTCGLDTIASPVKEEDIPELRRKVVADSINYSEPVTFRNKDIDHILQNLCTQKNQ